MSVPSCGFLGEGVLPTGFCAEQIPVSIAQARSVLSVGTTDFLALERGTNTVVFFEDTDGDGLADTRTDVVSFPGLNHGLEYNGGFVYASTDQFVLRWPVIGELPNVGEMEWVIYNINADGNGGAPFGHTTRTLEFDSLGLLYVSVGSYLNVDPDSYRSRIRRFNISDPVNTFTIDFTYGEVFADGVRNTVGMAFDRHGDLWGVENSADQLSRTDLGAVIYNDNPADELNRFREEDAGGHWGYPFCWTEYVLDDSVALGPGSVWTWPSYMDEYTDAQCRTDYIPPMLALQAHSAPLGLTFYEHNDDKPEGCSGGFPSWMDGYVFMAYHGSWNREIPTGYKVVYVEMDEDGEPVGEPVDLLAHVAPDAQWENGLRPVDVSFDDCGRLLVSSDGTYSMSYAGSMIVRITSTLEEETTPTPVISAPVTSAPVTEGPTDFPVVIVPLPDDLCFSGNNMVQELHKGAISINDLNIGDTVLVDDERNSYERVYSFGHINRDHRAEFLQLLPSKTELSKDHMIFVVGKGFIPASMVRVGDVLSDGKTVEAIRPVVSIGLFAPFTPSGAIIVNGVKASSFVSLQESGVLRLGSLDTPFSHQWLAHSFEVPHRLWCHWLVMDDMQTEEGMSVWIKAPWKAATWLLDQNPVVLGAAMIPFLAWLFVMVGLETVLMHPLLSLVVIGSWYLLRTSSQK